MSFDRMDQTLRRISEMSEPERIQRIKENEYRESMLRYMAKIEQHLFMQAQALSTISRAMAEK